MPMEKIVELNERFDIVVGSLVFHYVEDFEGVVSDIYDILYCNGNMCHVYVWNWLGSD